MFIWVQKKFKLFSCSSQLGTRASQPASQQASKPASKQASQPASKAVNHGGRQADLKGGSGGASAHPGNESLNFFVVRLNSDGLQEATKLYLMMESIWLVQV